MAVLWLISVLIFVSRPVFVPGALVVDHINVESGVGWLLGKLYVYNYWSSAQIYLQTNLTLEAQVSFQVLSKETRAEENEIQLDISNFSAIWSTSQGNIPDSSLIGNLSNWFSLVRDETGNEISSVYYPKGESNATLAFKKSLSQLISIENMVSYSVVDGRVSVVAGRHTREDGRDLVAFNKELRYDRNGVLTTVVSSETAQVNPSHMTSDLNSSLPLLSVSTRALSKLTLVDTEVVLQSLTRPQDLAWGTVRVTTVKDTLLLSDLLPPISAILDSCTIPECQHQLREMLQRLDPAGVRHLLHNLDSLADKKLILIDALVSSGVGVGDALAGLLGTDVEEDTVEKILMHFTLGHIPISRDVVNACLALLSSPLGPEVGSISPHLQHALLLSLGSMAGLVTRQDLALAKQITDVLRIELDYITSINPSPSSSSRLRRSAEDGDLDPLLHAVILDSIGNARSPELLGALVHHLTDDSKLTVKHSALKALGKYDSEESAEALLHVAETSLHPSMVHLAAAAYSIHPRRTRDLTHLISSPHHRSQRQLKNADSAILNVSMPAVNWNREFGVANISVDLNRRARNSFDISADALSSRYTFSLYDEISFDANLLLSGGTEHSQMWKAEICLQGTAQYDLNILKDFSHNLTAHQFRNLQNLIGQLNSNFSRAYALIAQSESAYSAARSQLSTALDAIPSRVQLVHNALASYRREAALLAESDLMDKANYVHQKINDSLSSTYPAISSAVEELSQALDDLIPARPQAFSRSVLDDNLPFTEGRFLVRYLPFAPQQAMVGIFNIYRNSAAAFSALESSYVSVASLTDPYGGNSRWLSPQIYLRNVRSEISILTQNIEATISAAHYLQLTEKMVDDLRRLLMTTTSDLQRSLELMEDIGSMVIAAGHELARAYAGSRVGLETFTRAYENARQQVDLIFGQKFHPSFPRVLKSCDQSGCGNYPATLGGVYNEGIEVVASSSNVVPSPLSGYVQLLNASVLPVSVQYLYSGSNYENSVILTPAESSYTGVQFILSNLAPISGISREPRFLDAGDAIATAHSIHIEVIKTIHGDGFRLDPTSFLQPRLEPNVNMELECNDVVTYVGGVVVDRRNLVQSNQPITRQFIGEPLVTDVPNHEFPQPFDLRILENHVIRPTNQITFLQSSTFLMVGQIPVQFDFSSVGMYSLNLSLSIGLLSGQAHLSSHPSFSARVQGSVRVGATVYADVTLQGTMLETELPLTLTQESSHWPMLASSSMGIILVPSTLNLTSRLIRRTASGSVSKDTSSNEEILQTQTLWSFSIPPLNQDEFYYQGLLEDTTPPIFMPLAFMSDQSYCFVQQLPGRHYDNPAFEVILYVIDGESKLNLTIGVGTSSNFDDILSFTNFRGQTLTLFHGLRPGIGLFFTIIATNGNGLQSYAICAFTGGHFYNRSPPQARINPIRTISSHPSQIRVLLSLFDESDLEEVQEVAIGIVPGGKGCEMLAWTPFNVSLIETPPVESGDILDQFSFSRAGRLVSDILDVQYDVSNISECGWSCHTHKDCRSFDYSAIERSCVLHDNIEGPTSNDLFENIFFTPSLQNSYSYEHYERLGMGNSTHMLLLGLLLEHGTRYHINLRLTNKLGYESIVSSEGFLVDLTPPVPILIGSSVVGSAQDVFPRGCLHASIPLPGCIDSVHPRGLDMVYTDGVESGSVYNGPTPLTDARFTANTNYLSANWNQFLDPESDIFGYTWCIGTTIGSCDIQPMVDPHVTRGLFSQEAWTRSAVATDLELSEGIYYITISATNDIAYGGPLFTTVHHSTPYMVDTTHPVVDDIINISYNTSTNRLSVDYLVGDGQDGVDKVEIALGRSKLSSGILDWILLSNQPVLPGRRTVETVELLLPDGVPLWLKLRATDRAGLQSVLAAASFFTVDRTPPITGVVYDGPTPRTDADYLVVSHTLCVNWAGFSDPDSGLGDILWLIMRVAGDDLVSSRNLVQEEKVLGVACESGLDLTHNVTYYSTLVVHNAAMETQSVTVTSDRILVDVTPPDLPDVNSVILNGKLPSHSPLISSPSSLQVTWGEFLDYESGMDHYNVIVTDQTSRLIIHSETVDGMEREWMRKVFSFRDGDLISIAVIGVNGAGGSNTLSTPMVTVDLTPPVLTNIVDGNDLSMDLDYQDSNDSLAVAWTVQDISGITSIRASIYEVRENRRTKLHPALQGDFLSVSTNRNTWTVDRLELTSGSRYIVSLTFTDGAGLEATYESNGVLVDLTLPVVSSVFVVSDVYLDTGDSVTMVTNPNQTEARWRAVDSESGISHFLVGVVNGNSSLVFSEYTIFDGSVIVGIVQTSPELSLEEVYSVVVIAVNHAGAESEATYSAPFRVSPGDSAGVVLDGAAGTDPATRHDVDFTDEITSITAHFYGFSSTGCGIAHYEWAVGSEGSSPESVLPFTSHGIFANNNSGDTGHAQLPMPGLENLIGRHLYITVRAVTGCGRVLQSSSNGFIIDPSPPSLEIIRTGERAIEHAQSLPGNHSHANYQTVRQYSSIWMASDSESGVSDDVMLRVGTFPGGSDILSSRTLTGNHLRDTIVSAEGVSTYVTMMTVNGAGVETEAFSEPISLDTTSPTGGLIWCNISSYPLPLARVDDHTPFINISSGRFSCCWSGVVDPESMIHDYAIAIGTSPTDQSVLSRTKVPVDTNSFTSSAISPLMVGVAYYAILFVTNGANRESIIVSNPLYFNITPPIISDGVYVIPNFKMADYIAGDLTVVKTTVEAQSGICLLVTDTVSILFENPAEASQGFTFELAMGYAPGSDDFLSYRQFFPIGLPSTVSGSVMATRLHHRIDGLDLISVGRMTLYLTVKVTNIAGLHSILASAPIYIKSHRTMERNWINDGINSKYDIEYQLSTIEIGASFSFGVNCPIRHGRWAVASVDGNMTQPYIDLESNQFQTPPGTTYQISSDQVQLFNEETYRILVQVADWNGEVHILRSNGVTVTTRGLVPGLVRDGSISEQDLNYQESVSMLSACWSGFGDGSPEQEIAYYEVAAGSNLEFPNTRSNIAPFTNVGLNTTHVFRDLNLVPELVEYYVTVRAYAVSGKHVEAHSNGIRVGLVHSIIPGAISFPRYQSDQTVLHAHWSGFQSNLPIRQYEWALGASYFNSEQLSEFCSDTNSNYSSFFQVFSFASVGLATSFMVRDLHLHDNTTYYLALRVLDQAKKCIAVLTAEGMTIDVTPPLFNRTSVAVRLGPVWSQRPVSNFIIYVLPGDDLMVEWDEFWDAESGIESYNVGLYPQLVCGNSSGGLGEVVFGPVEVGTSLKADLGDLALLADIPYVAVVRATNRAGVSSQSHSHPILLDDSIPVPGTVKDGVHWEGDVSYTSDLSELRAIFSHAILPPILPVGIWNGPCPGDRYYELTNLDPEWNAISSAYLVGHASSTLSYSRDQVGVSSSPPGIGIRTIRDRTSATEEVISGVYQTRVDLSRGGTFQADVLAARGLLSLQAITVTSLLFIDSGVASDMVAKFEPSASDFDFSGHLEFDAFGIQIYNHFTNSTHSVPQRVILWARDSQTLGQPLHSESSMPHIDLNVTNTYRVEFKVQGTDIYSNRKADLYVNNVLMANLQGLPLLTNNTRAVFSSFNYLGNVPPLGTLTGDLSVRAVFGNVTLPSAAASHLCEFGTPFYSQTSPVVQFRAGVGTRPGLTDVQELEVVSSPCVTCLPGSCDLFACDPVCRPDPYLVSIALGNLMLSPGYLTQTDQSRHSSDLLIPVLSRFQPATYYVVVMAITASGRSFISSSNGIVIDTSPPVLVSPIENFDLSFSSSQPVRFQGNNNTIAAKWKFRDEQSFIADYAWAIGTSPFSTNVQDFVHVGMLSVATASNLMLTHNVTYHVTIIARNGAGLTSNSTSVGITYIATELNITALEILVEVEFVKLVTFTDENGVVVQVRQTDNDNRAAVTWEGVARDVVEYLSWFIGSVRGSKDVLSPVRISLQDPTLAPRARIEGGVVYHGNVILANVSEAIALVEGKEEDEGDNLFFFEPGRLLYHSIEFCNFVHVCTVTMGIPSIVIRYSKDVEETVIFANAPTRLTVRQNAPAGVNIYRLHVLDRSYELLLETGKGLDVGSTLYAGFLNQVDLRKTYRGTTPYISNPFLTMSQTSREIARRFTEFGGPSFFVSFLGQESLNAPLDINVTLDASLDWEAAVPEVAYWDIDVGVWRRVSETCMNQSRVDLKTFTIAVQVCSTLSSEVPIPLPSHIRRREASPGMGASEDTPTITVLNYLERSIQFIIMRIGDVSSNSAPQLLLPSEPLQVTEDVSFQIRLEYTDAELDVVHFRLDSVPALGKVTVTPDGILTFEPCPHCTGTDVISVSIHERPIGENHTPLTDSGQIIFQINNANDIPLLFYYRHNVTTSTGNDVIEDHMIQVYVEANRSSSSVVVTMAAVDVDGHQDNLFFVVLQDGVYGSVSFRTYLDAVGVVESLPITLPENVTDGIDQLTNYRGYVTFLASHVTYLPSEPNFVGNDMFIIAVRDSRNVQNEHALVVLVEVLPSNCLNDGTCAGSKDDPECADLVGRRSGADSYNCSCPIGFRGQFCEESLVAMTVTPTRDCPLEIPVVQCDGDPCRGATCPSHPQAQCRPTYCGSCRAEWYHGNHSVTCHADNTESICRNRVAGGDALVLACSTVECECPNQPYPCPEDSVLVQDRVNDCCVTYRCVCPNISCPLFMECGQGVQPVPKYRGNQFPDRCCPEYEYIDVDECGRRSEHLCSDICLNEERTYSCACPAGRTLARDGFNCGVCTYNGKEYLLGDRVKIGCNWCLCGSDPLSGERWQCTASSCDDGCLDNGTLYPLGSQVSVSDSECVCQRTGRNSEEWKCTR